MADHEQIHQIIEQPDICPANEWIAWTAAIPLSSNEYTALNHAHGLISGLAEGTATEQTAAAISTSATVETFFWKARQAMFAEYETPYLPHLTLGKLAGAKFVQATDTLVKDTTPLDRSRILPVIAQKLEGLLANDHDQIGELIDNPARQQAIKLAGRMVVAQILRQQMREFMWDRSFSLLQDEADSFMAARMRDDTLVTGHYREITMPAHNPGRVYLNTASGVANLPLLEIGSFSLIKDPDYAEILNAAVGRYALLPFRYRG